MHTHIRSYKYLWYVYTCVLVCCIRWTVYSCSYWLISLSNLSSMSALKQINEVSSVPRHSQHSMQNTLYLQTCDSLLLQHCQLTRMWILTPFSELNCIYLRLLDLLVTSWYSWAGGCRFGVRRWMPRAMPGWLATQTARAWMDTTMLADATYFLWNSMPRGSISGLVCTAVKARIWLRPYRRIGCDVLGTFFMEQSSWTPY